jgi:hypothetical protein
VDPRISGPDLSVPDGIVGVSNKYKSAIIEVPHFERVCFLKMRTASEFSMGSKPGIKIIWLRLPWVIDGTIPETLEDMEK